MSASDCLLDLREESQLEPVPLVGNRVLTTGEQVTSEQRARERRLREIARLHDDLDGSAE